MKENVATSNVQRIKFAQSKHRTHALTFSKVADGRKQPIRGLWIRGSRYYARLNLENPITGVKKTRRVPLIDKDGSPVQTVAQAVAELKRLQTKRSDNALPTLTRTPKFGDYAARYLEFIGSGNGAKKPGTVEKEKTILNRWAGFLGALRVDQIKPVHVNRFIESRLKEKVSARTINLDVIGLRVVLKRAKMDGFIQRLPTEEVRPLKTTTEKRSLFAAADLDKLCQAAFETKRNEKNKDIPVTENAQQFVDYVKFMACSGARRNEAFGVRWDDVDFTNSQLFIRRQITNRGIEDLKNHEARVVDFNPKLKALLLAMKTRSHDASKWLFPSPQRGEKDAPAKSFRESLEMVRTQAKMPNFSFHDCRHHFISMCVMSGIDFMTIAAWVGHKDGGVLIGKVYGHLANEHRKAMADRLNFEPAAVQNAVNN
ncbi:MAG TPA: tyrosine-type recombinase/integrase [Verrucomicrobiae bacterium]|jgi:integrase|nr:tyrosine-type recombinase/integrase [Verrucomicrobiae bacterium]